MQTKEVITALAALAQESRLAVFRLLVTTGPVTATGNPLSSMTLNVGWIVTILPFGGQITFGDRDSVPEGGVTSVGALVKDSALAKATPFDTPPTA